MNERFVAVSTVTRSRIRGCFSKPRYDFSVTSGWQQMRNAIKWIKQFAEKKSRQRLEQRRCYYVEEWRHEPLWTPGSVTGWKARRRFQLSSWARLLWAPLAAKPPSRREPLLPREHRPQPPQSFPSSPFSPSFPCPSPTIASQSHSIIDTIISRRNGKW